MSPYHRILPILVASCVLAACSAPTSPTSNASPSTDTARASQLSADDMQATIAAQVQATVAAQVAAQPTAIPAQTNTPAPTATPPPPTATSEPSPTATPEPPTSTPEPPTPTSIADDPAVQTYARSVQGPIDDMTNGLSDMAALMSDAGADPTLIFDNDWRISLAAHLFVMQQAHQQLTEIEDVPTVMQPVHTQILDATSDCDAATRQVTTGIDTLQAELIAAATTSIESCSTKITEATLMLTNPTLVTMPTAEPDPRAVLEAYDRAFNSRALDALIQLFADDAVVISSDSSVMRGKNQLRAGLGETLGFENLSLASNPYEVTGDTITRIIRISWGPTNAPTIRDLRQEVVLQGGKITSLLNTAITP